MFIIPKHKREKMEKWMNKYHKINERKFIKFLQAKAKHRYVCGLREVRKQLSLETVRCVILARDIETDRNSMF